MKRTSGDQVRWAGPRQAGDRPASVVSGFSRTGNRSGLAVAKRVPPRRGVGRVAVDDRGEHLVDERQDAGRRSEADRDRLPRRAVGPQRVDEPRRLVHHRDVGVAEPVDRLLAVADDEDRRRDRIGGRAEAFAPALHELAHQLPLRAAGVLEFVDEDVAMARFEAEAALGELVHVLEQLDRALEHAGEVEQRVRLQRVLVLPHRDREDPPDPARHDGVEIAAERADRLVHRRRDLRRRRAVALPRVGRIAVVGVEAGPRELLAARLAFLGQEVGAQAVPIDCGNADC